MQRHSEAAARRRLLPLALGLALLVLLPVAARPASPDRTPPRIVSAEMQDKDGDYRSDRVKLTYSEPVRHVRDTDGRYPFAVAGYTIRFVGAAQGTGVVVVLDEAPQPDPAARPVVRYARGTLARVADRSGNEARRQAFAGTRAHERVPPPAPVDTDPDKDGVTAPADCAPNDAAISPKAADVPDLAFADTNCDGIDGTEARAVFVAPGGDDDAPGTRTQPKRTIAAGIEAATARGLDVLVAAGVYDEGSGLPLATGVNVIGGYEPGTWKRAAGFVVTVNASPQAALADGVTDVRLQLLTLRASADGALCAYGVRAIRGAELTLSRVDVAAGNGLPGRAGGSGIAGTKGGNGAPGANGACNDDLASKAGLGGAGGAVGGGKGGDGGTPNDARGKTGAAGGGGTAGGPGGRTGDPGKTGANGADGLPGKNGTAGLGGSHAASTAETWVGRPGTDGARGATGSGGGGGGGGGGQADCLFCIYGSGNGGGGGGGGGTGGTGGGGGGAGGGSFGIYLSASRVEVTDGSRVRAGNGGAGGAGGTGAAGAAGGEGAPGGSNCTGEIGRGGKGGFGGLGGYGGAGGGGAGGPSIGIYRVGGGAVTVGPDSTVAAGAGGAGGISPAGGASTGAAGVAAERLPAP